MKLSIKQLERETLNGGVICVTWAVSKNEGQYIAELSGTRFFTPDPNDPDFVPFEQLTENDVIKWLNIDDNWLDSVEAQLDADIDNQKNPPILHGLPWDRSEEQS